MRWCRHETQQQKRQRKVKYHLAKAVGLNRNLAYGLRDWNFSTMQNLLLENDFIKKINGDYKK